MLPLVNIFKNEIASFITERNQMYFALQKTVDLADDQRSYALDADILNNLVRVEIKFASGDAYQPAHALKEYQQSETESEIVRRFSNAEGGFAYLIRALQLFILSGTIVDVTAGIRYWFIKHPADLANLTGSTDLSINPSSTTFGFPKQFHELLARRVSIERKDNKHKKLSSQERRYDADLQAQLEAISHQDLNLEIIGELPNSIDLFNDGFDL